MGLNTIRGGRVHLLGQNLLGLKGSGCGRHAEPCRWCFRTLWPA